MSPAFWTFEPALFLTVFGMIFLAELPDKTAFATMLMAARRHPAAVFAGVAGAFVVQCLIAVAFGGVLSLLPRRLVGVGAGLLFLGFARALWNESGEESVPDAEREDGSGFWKTAGEAFVVIFIAEWGDLTQLATAALAAKHARPLTVFLGATAALWSVSALAVVVGHNVKGRIHPPHVQKAAAAVFACAGLYFLFR